MADKQVEGSDPGHSTKREFEHGNTQALGHQFAAVSLGGNASAHLGDVNHFCHVGRPPQGKERLSMPSSDRKQRYKTCNKLLCLLTVSNGCSKRYLTAKVELTTSRLIGQTQPFLRPSIVIPFRRDRDFVERNVLDEIFHRICEPAARVGLVGLGGVG